jgi:ligand-binding sensor domain-containing protein
VFGWFLSLLISTSPAPSAELVRPTRAFTIKDGLPDLNVTSFALANNGMLYAATQAGVARYNGSRWRALHLPKQLSSVDFRAIAFVGTTTYAGSVGAGLVAFDEGGEPLDVFTTKQGLPNNEIYALTSLGADALAVGTAEGVSLVQVKPEWKIQRTIETPRVSMMARSRDWLFIAHAQGLSAVHLSTGERMEFAQLKGIFANCVVRSNDRVFVGSQDFIDELSIANETPRYVRRFSDLGGERQIMQAMPLPASLAPLGEMSAITLTGNLLLLNGGKWSKSSVIEASLFTAVFSSSPVPLLWLGTTAGVVRATFGGIEQTRVAAGRRATATVALDDGSLVIGTERDVIQLAPNRVYTAKDVGLSELYAWGVRSDGKRAYIATRIGSVHSVDANGMKDEGLRLRPFDSLWDFAWFGGELLVLGRTGVHALRGKTWRPLEGAPTDSVFAALQTKRGLLLATESALLELRDGKLDDFGKRVGLPNTNVLSAVLRQRASAEEIWLGTNGGGLARVVQNADGSSTVDTLTAQSTNPLPNDTINALVLGADQSLWIGTAYGLVHAVCHERSLAECTLRRYGTDDGLPSDDISFTGLSRDNAGRIWVSTAMGPAVVTPSSIPQPARDASLLIERVLVNEVPRDLKANSELGYKEARVRFDFVLPLLFRGEQTTYATQLVGVEQSRSAFGESLYREFTSLPAGNYALHIWAKDYAGNEYGPERAAFSVLPPPWRTWWAYSLYALGLVALVSGSVRARLAQLRRRAEELEKIVEQRTAEVVKQKDEILAQKSELEASYAQADRIFAQLKEALKGSLLDERYKLGEELGQGGFGVVYNAEEVRTGAHYAVKVFRPSAGNDSVEALERFKLEAKSAQRIKHPNAIVIHDSGVSKDNIAYMAMELLHGQSLKQVMRERGKLPFATCHSVSVAVASALAAAHEVGIVHRDIKPDNVFMHEANGVVIPKVLDFGVAKQQDRAGGTLTMTGSVVGTPTYMAPERLEDKPYDGRSDVYSLGIMLYEMLAGRAPFVSVGDNLFSIVMQHLQQAPQPLVELDASIPASIHSIVMRTLAKDPLERPTAAELVTELNRAFESA